MKATKRLLVTVAAATTLVLTSCGGDAGETAEDPAPAAGSGAPAEESPSAAPEMIGDYPAFPHADYTYDLQVQCFCPYFGQPVTVTVVGGEVTSAVWAKRAKDHDKGAEVTDEWLRLSIDDVLREAANPSYDEVEVRWPEGAEHPEKVAIDKMENAIDDEITYLIADVEPAIT